MKAEKLIQRLEEHYFKMQEQVETNSTPGFYQNHLMRLQGMATTIRSAYREVDYPEDLRKVEDL